MPHVLSLVIFILMVRKYPIYSIDALPWLYNLQPITLTDKYSSPLYPNFYYFMYTPVSQTTSLP
jgi:hypothetical protein